MFYHIYCFLFKYFFNFNINSTLTFFRITKFKEKQRRNELLPRDINILSEERLLCLKFISNKNCSVVFYTKEINFMNSTDGTILKYPQDSPSNSSHSDQESDTHESWQQCLHMQALFICIDVAIFIFRTHKIFMLLLRVKVNRKFKKSLKYQIANDLQYVSPTCSFIHSTNLINDTLTENVRDNSTHQKNKEQQRENKSNANTHATNYNKLTCNNKLTGRCAVVARHSAFYPTKNLNFCSGHYENGILCISCLNSLQYLKIDDLKTHRKKLNQKMGFCNLFEHIKFSKGIYILIIFIISLFTLYFIQEQITFFLEFVKTYSTLSMKSALGTTAFPFLKSNAQSGECYFDVTATERSSLLDNETSDLLHTKSYVDFAMQQG